MNKLTSIGGITICLLLLSGCFNTQTLKQPTTTIDVPFIAQQNDGHCGVVATQMIERFWNKNTANSFSQTAKILYRPELNGTLSLDIIRYFKSNGYLTWIDRGTIELMAQRLNQNTPVISVIREHPNAPFHYVVITGMNAGHVFFHDYAAAHQAMTRSSFLKKWRTSNNTMITAVPEDVIL